MKFACFLFLLAHWRNKFCAARIQPNKVYTRSLTFPKSKHYKPLVIDCWFFLFHLFFRCVRCSITQFTNCWQLFARLIWTLIFFLWILFSNKFAKKCSKRSIDEFTRKKSNSQSPPSNWLLYRPWRETDTEKSPAISSLPSLSMAMMYNRYISIETSI
jgi:hypothetical protein